MVAQDGLIAVHVASRGVREAGVEGEVESDGLETDVGVRVLLSDGGHHVVVELLKLEPFGCTRQQQERVSDSISDEGLVNEFVGDDVRVASEGLGYLLPEFDELFVEIATGVVELVEDFADVVAEVVLAPLLVVALIPIWLARGVHGDLLPEGEGEGLIALDFVDQPDWHSVPAKLFGDDVLMEVEHGVDAVFSQLVDEGHQLLEVGFVVGVLFWFHAGPPR